MFTRKPVTVRAGERTKIMTKNFSSLDMTYRFRADPVDAAAEVSGTVEMKGSNWVFPKPFASQPLKRDNKVHKGIWDTFYSVYVIPDCDVTITRMASSFGHLARLVTAVSLVIAVALIVVIFTLFR